MSAADTPVAYRYSNIGCMNSGRFMNFITIYISCLKLFVAVKGPKSFTFM
jgi:hypothetical protein